MWDTSQIPHRPGEHPGGKDQPEVTVDPGAARYARVRPGKDARDNVKMEKDDPTTAMSSSSAPA
jgi:hypothetical protein